MHPRTRTLLMIVGIAAGALAAGVFAGTRITSPADAAARAEPPAASDVTVPVELRELQSQVVTRGDVSYTGAVNVEPQFPGLESTPVVTGSVPDVGDTVRRGDVLLEVVGRPVIALPGEVPMYRTLRPGMSGPDIEQLEKALDKLGFDPGEVDDDFTGSTSRAVEELFQDKGYEPPAVDPDIQAALDAADENLDAAEDEVRNAESALQAASKGASEAEKLQAQHDVDTAERQLEQAKTDGDADAIADAELQLKLARTNLDEVEAGPDVSAERAALDAARSRLTEAQQERDQAAVRAGTPLPASEVVFVPSLPRRVDEVNVGRGDEVDGAVMSISGTDMVVTVNVDAASRELLDEGMDTVVDLPNGEQVTAPITSIREASGEDASGYDVRISPDDLNNEQVEALRSANVRVTIPVASTDGEVLAVPLAALTAGTGGEARVEVQRPSDGNDGGSGDHGATTELVEVEVGLTAEGYAEITPVEDGAVAEGDLVVVGSEGASAAADDTEEADDSRSGDEEPTGDDSTPDSETGDDEPGDDDGLDEDEPDDDGPSKDDGSGDRSESDDEATTDDAE
ncbi:peptidoglycan-binding protein [Phytoactinopolyspora halotolerans]|uniref:peptidoglycan-binding protein n=1 Tax=Phytoactinopolyspora halotolerans TaxID=1981512 RepID=UPI001C2071FC|nr:peptidoglycan-binding protein [Phytoactinopolyspora halotolerans]